MRLFIGSVYRFWYLPSRAEGDARVGEVVVAGDAGPEVRGHGGLRVHAVHNSL